VDAAIAINTVQLRKTTKARGTMLYAHAAIISILSDLKANHVRLTIDGQQSEKDLLICAIQNGKTYGGGFKVAPRAKITDGKLNVCMATRTNPVKALYALAKMKNGKHESLNIFSDYEAQELTLDFDQHVPSQCDGEELPGTHFEVGIIPATLDVVVPQNSDVLI
jgi:diacylglycerol kinase family enzyme